MRIPTKGIHGLALVLLITTLLFVAYLVGTVLLFAYV